jgi:hypothetical protein
MERSFEKLAKLTDELSEADLDRVSGGQRDRSTGYRQFIRAAMTVGTAHDAEVQSRLGGSSGSW